MKLIIDDAHIDLIKKIYEYYPVDGVTTNPSILAKSGRQPFEVLKEIRSFIGEEAELHVQVVAKDADGMVAALTMAGHGIGYMFPVPAIVDSKHTSEILQEETQVKNVLRLAKEAEVSIFSIGALSKDSILYEVEYLKDEDFQALEKNKAVGDIASRYFDINGNIALKELDDRVVGFGLEELREKEWTIAIAVGVNKVDAIIGALRAGFMNVLYTDEKTAREILNRNLLG